MKKINILLFPLLLLTANINAMQSQVKVVVNECIEECLKIATIDELRNVRSKTKYQQRELLNSLSTNVSLDRAIEVVSRLKQPQIVLWFTDYKGYVYQRGMRWFSDKLLKNDCLNTASFWLTDLTAWCFLSTKEAGKDAGDAGLQDMKKTRPVATKLKAGQSIPTDQCPLLTYASESLTKEAIGENNRLSLLRANCFFEWLAILQGNIANLYGNIQNQLCRSELRPESLRFSLRQIGFESDFLNCLSNTLNDTLLDVDFSLVFPILQYLEGIYYCTQIVQKAIKEGKDECAIVFLLHNKEFTYYIVPGDAELFESFQSNLQMILNSMNFPPIDVSVYFVPFMYGQNFYDAPYQDKSGSLSKKAIAKRIKG